MGVVAGVEYGLGGWVGQSMLGVGRWSQGDVVKGLGVGGWDLTIFDHFKGRGIGDCSWG